MNVFVLRVIAFVVGAAIVLATIGSAVRTVILPRGIPAKLGRFVFISVRALFNLRARSSILTLGFEHPADIPSTALVFSEAALGLILLALLITYLPSIYGSFSRREAAVTALEVRAGSPPSGAEMIWRYNALERMDRLIEVWA